MARFSEITVGTSPTQIPITAGTGFTLINTGTVDVYINDSASVDTDNGSGRIQPNGYYTCDENNRSWDGELWAVSDGEPSKLSLEV